MNIMNSRYLLDTNICVFILRGKYNLDKKLKIIGRGNCLISEITVAELLYGAYLSDNPEVHKREVLNFCDKFEILPIGNSLDFYAKTKAKLRKEGNLIDDFDLLIASSAFFNNLILVTDNIRHFERLEIPMENWIER